MPEESLVKRILPHSAEAEQSVLGAMLYSEDAINTAMEILDADDFYNHQNAMIYRAIMDLYREGKPTDIVNVQDRLRHMQDVPPEVSSLDFLKNLGLYRGQRRSLRADCFGKSRSAAPDQSGRRDCGQLLSREGIGREDHGADGEDHF